MLDTLMVSKPRDPGASMAKNRAKSSDKESGRKTMASAKAARSAASGQFLSSKHGSSKAGKSDGSKFSRNTTVTGKSVVPRRAGGTVFYVHLGQNRDADPMIGSRRSDAAVERSLGEAFVS